MPPPSQPVPALALNSVTVRFGAFTANDRIDLSVAPGEVHALLGENGAGKTTLMRVVAGLLQPQEGEIRINGQKVSFASPLDAAAHGIGMVHQHFMLIPTLTVAENCALGLKSAGRFFPDRKAIARKIQEISDRYDLQVDPYALVSDLSVAGQQRVEIIKALFRGAKIFVLDEPTAVLAPQEVEGLFRVLRMLAEAGTAIIFISHKLSEVMEISDRVSVLRLGKLVFSSRKEETTGSEIAKVMIGGTLEMPKLTEDVAADAPAVLEARALAHRDTRGVAKLDGLSFTARSGEIIGIAGVDGNGQQELAEILAGLKPAHGGSVLLNGAEITRLSTGERIARGLAHIPEDRQATGLVDLSITDNAALEVIHQPPLSRNGFLNHKALREQAVDLIAENDVRCFGPDQRVMTLSGGNQQKVILGRTFRRNPKAIIAVQPTRGLDVGATSFVHRQLLAQRKAGAAVVLISTELEEILALSDRILVIYDGKIRGELPRAEVDIARLGAMMTGQTAE